ncbi:MAG: STAS domain-containing protein [Thermoanaerobaculales bacterium]|nr:STAS domain-containing protein [Thermoanaerobaculales bacterium]
MGLTIEQSQSSNGSLIRVVGEVDLYSSPELRKAILKAVPSARGGLEIDLEGVTYIDSSGVATLVEGLRSAREHGTGFALVTPSPAVRQVLELARLDSVFEVR